MAKRIFGYVMLILYMVGSIGGFGYCMWIGAYFIAVGVAATAYMAWPKAVEYFHTMND